MDSSRDTERECANISDDKIPMTSDGQGVSRRKFTRNALVGSAVLLTLSNRSAWGATATACISTSLLTSFTQASRPLNPDQQIEIDRYYDSVNYYEKRSSDEYPVGDQTCYEYKTNNGSINITDLQSSPPAE